MQVVLGPYLLIFRFVHRNPQVGVEGGPQVVLRHLQGNERVTDSVLLGLFRNAEQMKQFPVVLHPK